jgi:hypothetical protein
MAIKSAAPADMNPATAHAIWIAGETVFLSAILVSLYATTSELIRNWPAIVRALKVNNHDDA